jgi:hypothetical protein
MATTTNYGWTTPDDTALVKDGAAAIRTLGSSVDTTTKALNPSTTLGDIEYRSSTANTNTRLGIGSTGQVLTVASGVPSWATPAAGGGTLNWSAVNSGGTNLTGAATITVSGITSANHLLITWLDASMDGGAPADFEVNINADTGTNYFYGGTYQVSGTSDYNGSGASGTTRFRIGRLQNSTAVGYGYCLITGGATSGVKALNGGMGADQSSFNSVCGGWWNNSATITSVSVKTTTGNFDGGKIYVFKSA